MPENRIKFHPILPVPESEIIEIKMAAAIVKSKSWRNDRFCPDRKSY